MDPHESAVTAVLSDPDDERVAHLRGLTDRDARADLESEHGIFVLEGALVVERALALMSTGRLVVETVLTNSAGARRLAPALARSSELGPEVLVATTDVMREVTGFNIHRGVVAVARRWELPPLGDFLAGGWNRLLAVEDVVDGENMGSLFRNAAAFGVDGVVVSPRCVDPLYRRSVRVSMGEALSVPWTRAKPLEWPGALREGADAHGADLVVLSPRGGLDIAQWASQRRPGPVVLAVGSEGPGASDELMAVAHKVVRIPMAREVDSLNVATAAAVGLYALVVPGPS